MFSVQAYFYLNAGAWRGPWARQIRLTVPEDIYGLTVTKRHRLTHT
jgi:hypothetical protein